MICVSKSVERLCGYNVRTKPYGYVIYGRRVRQQPNDDSMLYVQ